MAYILPESVLEPQLCSSCKQYLSCPPTKAYFNGEIKCGRCSSPDDGGTISAYEFIAKNLLFPCCNRFDGCSKLLHYGDVKQHEKTCTGTTVKCPMCPDSDGSVLQLIHHFKIKHSRHILVEPCVECNLNQEGTRFLLFCHRDTNRVFVIKVEWNREVFALSYWHATGKPKTPQLTLEFSEVGEEDDSLSIRTPLVEFTREYLHTFEVPVHLTRLRCKLVFDEASPLKKIVQFQSKPDQEYKKKVLPRMYLDNDFRKKHGVVDTSGFKLSTSGMKLNHPNYSLHIACNFCENFFVSSGSARQIYYIPDNSEEYVCGSCYDRGIQQSLNNSGIPFCQLEDGDYHLLNFYCKYGCGRFFRSGELLSHENQCLFNEKRGLSDEDYVKTAFGDSFVRGEKYSKENVIFDVNKFTRKGKIFVATRDNFRCVIDYETDSTLSKCYFHVNHCYDTDVYYVSVHKWEDKRYSEEYNDFSMKTKDCEGPSLFAVILKEVQEDLEIFYDV